ncbi:uncharacterized protein LOC133205898 [Saccostrea echinata]|uniref:uncharacterized protein LOC133205898 n=1 Tax=Saccostrea echinata TaxID=191078 RepID=UPI002A80B50D|nr:uncharacterized protein LOC133205898 [Saccostrea echinata]
MKLFILVCVLGLSLAANPRLQKMEEMLNDLTRQLVSQQFYVEERIRSDGDSGIKQVRRLSAGTDSFNSETTSAIHSHPNYKDVIGFGEVNAVLNGVEFRTRHNDYSLEMPSLHKANYHLTEKIPYPQVPPSVTAKHTVPEQIAEMKEYFRAFRLQNSTIRNYKPYFKPVLCYMEGNWEWDTKHLHEPFHSETHHLDAMDYDNLADKVRLMSYTGMNDLHEDLAFLPKKIMDIDSNGKPRYAQWIYRILCNPIHSDVPLKVFKPIDDVAFRVTRKYNMSTYSRTEEARFTVAASANQAEFDEHEGYGKFEDRAYAKGLLDSLMHGVPGANNYRGGQHDTEFNHTALVAGEGRDRPENTARYHREYKLHHGMQINQRGFSDSNLWMAQNHQNKVASVILRSCKTVGTLKTNCTSTTEKFSYAIPLEIIYLNPLHSWNPYNLDMKNESEVTENGRKGDSHNANLAYKGISTLHFYQTPVEFFGNVPGQDVGVLDPKGAIHRVMASGIQTILPKIPGVGEVRQRWPIYPLHREGDSVGKEADALLEMLNHMSSMSPIFQEPATQGKHETVQPDLHFRLTSSHMNPLDRHDHEFFVPATDWEQLLKNDVWVHVLTAPTEGENQESHSHSLQIRLDKHTHKPIIQKCDDQNGKCWDGHTDFEQVTFHEF